MADGGGRKISSSVRKHARRDQKGQRGRLQPVSSEHFKELQMRAKEEKETKRARMDGRHEFLLSTVAERIGMPYEVAEEFMLEGNQLNYFDQFFAENGLLALIFYYKSAAPAEEQEGSEQKDAASSGTKKRTDLLWITDGTKDPYPGCCLFYVRLNPSKAITSLNIHQEAHFGMLESNGEGLLGAIERLLGSLFLPALQNYGKWGELTGAEGQKVKQQFLSKLSSFVSVLGNAQASINDTVKLTPCTHPGLVKLKTSTEIISAAGNSDIVEAAEQCALVWCREIEQILTESEQMRKEADDVGPKAELEYWKKRLARYDSLTTNIKTHQCKTVVSILVVAKSKVLKTWKNFDIQITDFTNECKDNVKFLYTLEKYCEPLYKCNPVTMLDSIPGLMNAIRMINSYSRYYNTSERMTALFVKVTQQMINACRAHLTDHGYHKVWEQDRDVVIHKMEECLNLNREYQQCFQQTKKRLEDHPEERPFDFSEMYIFGKFNNFSRRLEKLIELFKTIGVYSSLSLSHIEGIEQLNSRFNLAYTNLKKKPYNVLDQRKMDFDGDYEDFTRQLQELNAQLLQLMDDTFKNSTTTMQAVNTARRFMRLKIPAVNVKDRYHFILTHFQDDLQMVQTQYNANKHAPPTLHNRPPIANAIGWCRQLYQRINQPVKLFYQLPGFLDLQETRRLIRGYNHLAQVLVEYELIHLKQWRLKMSMAKQSLLASLLVRSEGRLIVNFDTSITEFFREVQVLQGMGIEIPHEALVLYTKKTNIMDSHEMVNLLVSEYDRVIGKIPELYSVLMMPHKEHLDVSISPGLTSLRWTSVNLMQFFESSQHAITQFEQFVDNVTGIQDDRILQMFEIMLKTPLVYVPQQEVITVTEFVQTATELCQTATTSLENRSIAIEVAVNDLIALLLHGNDGGLPEETPDDLNKPGAMTLKRKVEQKQKLLEEAALVFEHFEQQNIETLLRLLRGALESLKKRVAVASSLSYTDQTPSAEHYPFFVSDIVLSLPNLVTSPNLEEMQQAMNQVIQIILNVMKSVFCWKQERLSTAPTTKTFESDSTIQIVRSKTKVAQRSSIQKLRTYYHVVSEHKEISKLVSSMGGAVSSTKSIVKKTVDQFNKYEHLWANDRKEYMTKYAEDNPGVNEYQQEMHNLTQIEADILVQPDTLTAAAVQLNTEQIKMTLVTEAKQWKVAYGRTMSHYYQTLLEKTFESIEEWDKSLSRPLEDLDDIRSVMATLREVRDNEIGIDTSLGPIEECYTLLQKHGITVTQEEIERVDTVRYLWINLNQKISTIVSELLTIQNKFRENLLENIEQFNADSASFVTDYDERGPMVVGIHPREASDRLIIFQGQFEELWRKHQTYTGGEELFGLIKSNYPELSRIRKELNLLQKLYSLYNNVMDSVDGYYDIPWTEVDIEKINNELLEFQNKCRKLPKALKEWQAFRDLQKKIDDFNAVCPLLERMADKAMKERHWKRIEEITGHKFDFESENFTLRNIMEAPLLQNIDDIEDVCIAAVKEQDIDAKMKQVAAEWAIHNLALANFKTRGELLLRGEDTTEIISLMEDSLMMLSSLMSNRYNAPFKKNIQKWVKDLTNTSEILENWLVVQNLWVYLEAVFVGGDIAKQLPKEAKRFQSIDKSWVKIMNKAHETPNVVQCCVGDETLGQLLPHLLEQLELCQKSLTGYLEKKRLIFPRFFFVSDPALLEILGQASDSHTIQAHLLSVFDNVKTVTFHEKEYDRITHINSREPETVELEKPVMAQGNVEIWLGKLLNMAKQSLHGVIRQAVVAIKDPNFELIDFLNSFPAQVGLLGLQIIWTADATHALKSARSDKKIMSITDQRFLDILNSLIEMTTQELGKIDRVKFETLITIHLHQRDIFNDLVRMNIKSHTDFEWLKQSRFYFNEDTDKCVISITDVNFTYQDEFLGCNERLVITPLTDRCYITLAQALGMSMGGSPAGPAGTGKTETTKDMGKALGKYVVVFNCSDQMDFRGLGRIYKGLAQSGSWGCFDEFNRIELPVLSVAAQQVAVILQCRKERKPEFIFTDGDVVSLNPEFGLFLTMNPGYAGRQELPENLKMNFRPIAMMVPDRQIIIRVKLASCGFLQNVVLACKFYTLYKLCEEQLSKQVHYDFGLRNILSVLRSLGPVKRMCPNDSEEMIVMRGLRDMNLSKLVDEDEPLFRSLIDDLFPGIKLETAGYPDLETAIDNRVREASLINHPSWNLKLIQLFETQRVRHGFMVLGPSGTGKTCCIHVLMKAMTDCNEPHREMRMNPKAITAPQMFGRLDVATNDWTDGIFSTLWRRTHKVKKGEHIWLLLDGPVDTLWIENLNSVLDDNKTLTLANGDRIPMAPDCKIVFEPHNVDNASPATVSRNGMVFMSSSGLDWNPILRSWLMKKSIEKKITQSESDILLSLFEASFLDIFNYVYVIIDAKMELLQCNYIAQACIILEGYLMNKDEGVSLDRTHLEHLYIFSLMWSIGALLELNGRTKMEEWIRENKPDLDLPQCEPDSGDTIFEYFPSADGSWEHWKSRVEEYIYPTETTPSYNTILVPNVDNVRTDFLIHLVAKQSKPVLLIGEQGTAKTVIIQGAMSRYDIEQHLAKNISFSSATTPGLFQRSIESYIDKRVGSTYGPPAGKKMTVFIDDINMPRINEWGDQITNEIVRQTMEMRGFYSLEKPGDFTHIEDIQFLAAMIHPGGGRNDIPQRLKRQFSVINCTLPSNASIDKIFGAIGCGYFCKERMFDRQIIELVPQLVVCTRRVWQLTKVKMLPTPAKFHYVFNLRDLSRIWEGMLHIKHENTPDIDTLLGLWKHECTRVIADRFTSDEDKEWFDRCLGRVLEEELDEGVAEKLPKEPYFVDFLRDPPEPTGDEPEDFVFEAPKIYESVPSLPDLEERLINFLQQYNETIRGSGMDLVFFKDCMIHLIKISRIIRTDRGNALLVGVGGSGKQSLTRLASFIAGYKIFQIQLSRSYNVNSLMDDLKILYRTAGQQGKGITFLFTDQEIKDEGFLEYINMILSSGEVSNLFARDEIDEICSELIPVMKKEFPRRPPTPDNLYNYFLSRARQNLHVVLCFSPVGEKFRSRSLKFPGLFSGCTMDWFSRWPEDALIAVAQHFLSSYDIICTGEVKAEVVKAMGVIQDFVAESCVSYFERFRRTTHVTPKSYLSFIAGYKTIYTERKLHLQELSSRMESGLQKLLEASESVAQLAKELEVKEKDLVVASKEAEQVLAEVTVKAQAAEKVKAEVQKVKDKAQSVADIIAADKSVAEEKLEKARPALEEAERALQTITAADIATVRKLGKPPHLIMRIMDCVLLLLQRRLGSMSLDPERPGPKPSWAESLKLMSQGGFLQSLMNFPKDTINEETVELLQAYFAMEDYNMESAKKVCGNVAGLCSWTTAMAAFFAINKEVLPLKANLAIQEVKFAAAQEELAAANATLDEKQKELDVVRAMYDEAMAKKQALIDDAETCKRKMKAASALIEGLGGEKERWTEQSKQFQAQIERLVGDVLLASAFLSYAGPFNQEFRLLLMQAWKEQISKRTIPFSHDLNLVDMLTDPATVAEWNLQGLPNDELSVQNGIIVNKASRYPLLIDPQGQGKTWIKNKEAEKEFQITTLNNKYFRTHLEDSLSLGKSLLIEDVEEELDPALDNVLEKNFIKAGTMLKVKVGDKEVDVMKGFNLCITTKLPNPSYTPEISARTSIIDFTVTVKGLEDQLLGRVILSEKQELESERVKLMEEVTANKRKMKELEDNLLYRLTSTKGSLVDDESLIEVLRTTKVTADDVTKKLEIAAQTEIKINSAREEYRPVAARGSVLYFLIVEMSLVNVMYQTSLIQFLNIFDLSMARSAKSPVTSRRVNNVIQYLTFEAFRYSTRGLYEEHKFLFTLLLALKIDMQKGSVKHQEFQTFIKGGAALDLKACPPKTSKWITDMTWLNLVELNKLQQFSEILNQISRNDKNWKVWFDSEAPEEAPIPDGYSNSLDTFRKLILIRAWCPDRVLPQARNYISESLGKEYAEGVILDMEHMWDESTNRIPMICFLSMGSDPSNNIDSLARKHKLTCQAISMGQGQEVHARRMLQQSQTQGGWLLVQNGHLALDFLEELLLSVLETENVHEGFRLWMTTEVHNKFPINLLQTSIKYTFEPPQGVKAGLKRTYTNLTQEQLDVSNLNQWKPMLYAVAFLHTTVQERRKFGPLGWNIPYEFNQGDFNASIQYVQNLLDDMDLKKGISWGAVRYMLGEIQYGGRVTDDYDKRLLNTYARLYFGEHMFHSGFHFFRGFPIPVFKTVREYCDYIDSLSAVISPEVFGMHPNADITYQSNTAKTCLDTILNIQPKDSSSGGGETRESIVRRQAGEMLEKLPEDYLPHEVKARLQKMGSIAPMNIFLRQEIDRMQRVIGLVRSTLQDLQLAIDGTIVMSETLRNTLDNMYDARVPNAWKKVSWESTTIGFWFTELLERDQQFRTWVFGGRPNSFWMTGFFNPQGFLTAMRQEVARAHKGWALDSVVIHNDVTRSNREDITAPPIEGVYIYGLFLDGGGWDRRNSRLVEPQPKVLYVPMPVVHVYAVNTKEGSIKDPRLYVCPVYKKPRRTDLTFVTALFLRSNQSPDHWIRRGTALLCDIK